MLEALVLAPPVLAASSTGASTSATVLVAPVLASKLLVADSTRAFSTGATFIEAPVLLTMCYKHQTVGTFLQLCKCVLKLPAPEDA